MIKIQHIHQGANALTAGFIAVLVGFTSSVALIYQAVVNLGGNADLVASWLMVLGLSMGILSITLSVLYRVPILIAWSTPGAALLISSSQGFTLEQATGAFIFCAVLIFISGVTGLFEKLMRRIPLPLASAMLAGVLVGFGIDVFNLLPQQTALIASMLITYLITKLISPRWCMIMVLIVGLIVAWSLQLLNFSALEFKLATLQFTNPQWSWPAVMNIGLPLFIVTMASQNLPGIAVMQAHNYPVPISKTLTITGATNILIAPFGGYAINFAAITAAICMTPEVNPNPNKRFLGSVAAGLFYILLAIGSGTLISLLDAMPSALILALAGIALFGTIASSLKLALSESYYLEASMITFLVTASDLVLLNIGSPLWGILAGCLTLFIQQITQKKSQPN
ncbi:benzoate/H(+) symporter BenE family transporter [Pseudoalteromonas tunicata]|uniref:benzoate/H(+) symporter BenE family transporter n=1 Tax=Pseudoalteromonas tunicata TaxID=314281 RepID=UPI00273D38EA|nr:benzoate/H(+) symporter BenE family transporter [Pseudoalteromonas tunicata]MDP5214455.1 benzoate/H(+) symporter BenE family transporter [Pseudoalteromonas tunicata]